MHAPTAITSRSVVAKSPELAPTDMPEVDDAGPRMVPISTGAEIEAILGVEKHGRRSILRSRALIVGALLAVVVAAAYGLWSRSDGKTAINYVTAPVALGNLTVIVTATGSAQPITQVNVSSELSGTVRTVLVDYNSVVKTGQPMAELDTEKLRATVESVRARLDAANARVADAAASIEEKQADYQRKQALIARSAGTTKDLELAKSAYDRAVALHRSALAEVKVVEADLRLNEINLTKACICSPIDGIVLKRSVDPGQIVASSLQAPVLFVIAQDLRRMELQVDVDEADVGKVRIGQKATFSVDAYPDRKFPAEIRDVRYGSETVQGVVTYKAVLSIDNSELMIRPGMTATAEIVVDQVADALLVPNPALRFTPAPAAPSRSLLRTILPGPPSFRPPSKQEQTGPRRTVWVLRDGEPAAVPVIVGPTDGKNTAIRQGTLEAGQVVILDAAAPRR